MKENLADKLEAYSKTDYYPFHMPGHKRNPKVVSYKPSIETDITEIDGFDNLHHPEGILREGQERAAKLYHTKNTFFCVNGSTAALLSAISACTTIGGTLLMARNCHKAVYHGCYIRQLHPIFLYPEQEKKYGLSGGILPEEVRKKLEKHPKIQAVLLTSPTYDGIVSDVEAIGKICHEFQVPLIVDEAHGAHFPFHEAFPVSALEKGADVVIQSLHKTLPSMTQTALLHQNSDRVSYDLLKRYMGIYQSSSPSYPLMASIDSCICNLYQHGEEMFRPYVENLMKLYDQLGKCEYIGVVKEDIVENSSVFQWDMSKIILFDRSGTITGRQLYKKFLNTYHLQMEMETPVYVLAITSVGDTPQGMKRLADAALDIDRHLKEEKKPGSFEIMKRPIPKTERKMELYQAMDKREVLVEMKDGVGQICGDFIYLYPPGIPLVVPGEIITEELIQYLEECRTIGLDIHGVKDGNKIGVVYE